MVAEVPGKNQLSYLVVTSERFEAVLWRLDNHPDILKYTFSDGSSYWLAIRFSLRFIHMKRLAGGAANQAATVVKSGKSELIKYIRHAYRNSPFHNTGHADIISLANYEGNSEIPNRMTFFLKECNEWKRKELLYSPRMAQFSGLKDTYSFDYFYYRVWLRSKLYRRKPVKREVQDIQIFMDWLRPELAGFIPDSEWAGLRNILLQASVLAKPYRKILRRYLEKVKPKLLLVSEGNNGDWKYSILFQLCRELGISTAEVQHGMLSIGMKYGEDLASDAVFRSQKTDYMFTFGSYHCSQTNAAAKCIPLGHYHLEMMQKKLLPTQKKERLQILFICEGEPAVAVNNGLIERTEAALSMFGEPFELIVRLHPSEVPNAKYEKLMSFEGSRYSQFKDENIYQLIQDADLVIGHSSTVLFEVAYFYKLPLICRDEVSEQYIPGQLGHWFGDAMDLLNLLQNREKLLTQKQVNRDFFWADGNVKDNFRKFWKESLEQQ